MMNFRNAMKMLAVVATVLFAAGFSGCKCCADDHGKKCDAEKNARAACGCPVLMVVRGEETTGPDGCAVCTVWSEQYSPCMNAVAACPAQSCKSLEKIPLCEKCKKKIMECAKLRQKCSVCGKSDKPCPACCEKLKKCCVRHLMTAESMKANQNCKDCRKKAENAAKKKAEQIKNGQPADDDDAIVVVEEEFSVIGPVMPEATDPATANTHAHKKTVPAEEKPVPVAEGKKTEVKPAAQPANQPAVPKN